MPKWFNRIVPQTGFARNVMTLMTGTVVSQVIAVLATPIISRIYGTADYGVFSTLLSIVSVGSVLVSMRYEMIIVLVKQRRDAINLLVLSLGIAVAVATLSLIAVIVLPRLLNVEKLFDTKGISSWLIFLPVSILLIGMWQTLENYCIRRKDYKKMRRAPVTQNLTKVTVNIALGLQSIIKGGLILGYIAGQIAGLWMLLAGRVKPLWHSAGVHFSCKRCFSLARMYRKTALILVSTGLVGALANYMPVFLLGYFFGASTAGVYHMSFAIVNLPTLVIGKALADVSYKHTIDIIHSQNSLAEYIERVVARLFVFAVLPVLLLTLFAKPLFVLLLGAEWQLTGVFIQILLPYFFLRFLSSPATVFIQTGKSNLQLYWQIMFLVLTLLSLLSGKFVFNSALITIKLLSATNTASYFALLWLNFRLSGARLSNFFNQTVSILRDELFKRR